MTPFDDGPECSNSKRSKVAAPQVKKVSAGWLALMVLSLSVPPSMKNRKSRSLPSYGRISMCLYGNHLLGFWVPQTLQRFELWGACKDLNLPSLPNRDPHNLARRAQRNRETQQFILVRATLRCNTLLQLCGGLPRGAEDELVGFYGRVCRLQIKISYA